MSSRLEDCCQALLQNLLPRLDPPRAGTCLDVGVGTFAFYCERFAELGFSTIAIEPLPIEPLHHLCQTRNISLIEACLADVDGEQTLYLGQWQGFEDVNYSSLHANWFGASAKTRSVPSVTLAQVIQQHQIQQITCLKLDIEGAEARVICQLPQLPMAQLPKVVMFEYGGGDFKAKGRAGWSSQFWQATQDCLKTLQQCGYQTTIVVDGAWGVPEQIINLQSISDDDFAGLFHAEAAWGNIIAIYGQTLLTTDLAQICSLYHDPVPIYGQVPAESTADMLDVTIATSISPSNLENQQRAIASWIALGFRVVSLNAADEIPALQPLYPNVVFHPVHRDARLEVGRALVYLNDIVTYLTTHCNEGTGAIVGIVNSDICLKANAKLRSFLQQQAKGALIFLSRVEVEQIDQTVGQVYTRGFDGFFFEPSRLPALASNPFCLGLPWWDFWFPWIAHKSGLSLKYFTSPVAYHLRHPAHYAEEQWLSLGIRFTEDFNAQLVPEFKQLQCQNPSELRLALLRLMDQFLFDLHRSALRIALPDALATNLLELNPEAAALHLEAGQIHWQQGRWAEAIAAYQRALSFQPDLWAAMLALAIAYLTVGQVEPALPLLAQIEQCQPTLITAEQSLQIAQRLRDLGHLTLAQQYSEKAIAAAPNTATAYLILASVFIGLGKLELAQSACQRAIDLQPEWPEAYWQMALIVEAQAIEAQQQALDLDPGLLPLTQHFEMGLQFSNQGQFQWAARAYQRVLKLRPDWAEAHCNLGNTYSSLGRLEDAVQCLRRAIAFQPNFPEAHSNLGNVLVRLGQIPKAILSHQQAVRLNPQWAELHYNLADALVKGGRSAEAIVSLQEALRLKPELAPAQQLLQQLTKPMQSSHYELSYPNPGHAYSR